MKKRRIGANQKELIPIEKRKNIILIEPRRKEKVSIGSVLMLILGLLIMLYCISIGLFMQRGTYFFLMWGVIGAVIFMLGVLSIKKIRRKWIPSWLQKLFLWLIFVGGLIFVITEGYILKGFFVEPIESADYCIVLGAHINDNGPSDVLRRRLDTACEYLQDNPDTIVIVSGGQGATESMTEAQGMKDYLVEKKGISNEILLEETSTNTYENLKNSAEFINLETDVVVIVTNNFHISRSLHTAKKIGYQEVYGLAADVYPGVLPNNMLREFFAVWKSILQRS